MSVDWILSQLLGTEAVIAARAVREAADLADWLHREGSVGVLSKSDASPVTVADFAVQALVADRLASAFPDVSLVAEEDASDLRGIKANGLQAHVIDVVRRLKPGSMPLGCWTQSTAGAGCPAGATGPWIPSMALRDSFAVDSTLSRWHSSRTELR